MGILSRSVFVLFGLLFLLPVVFVSQTSDRQSDFLGEAKGLLAENKYPEALALLRPELETARQNVDWGNFCKISTSISNAYSGMEKFDSACIFLEREVQFLFKNGQGEASGTGRLLVLLGYNYTCQDQYIAKVGALKRATKIFEKIGEVGYTVAYAYNSIGQSYVRWNNHSIAKQYFDAALRVDTAGDNRTDILSQLATYAHNIGDEKLVMEYYLKGVSDPKIDLHFKPDLDAAGASAFVAVGQFAKASSMLQSSIAFYEKDKELNIDNILVCLTSLADVAIRQNNPDLALKYYSKAESLGKQVIHGKSREKAKLYIEMGRFFENSGQLDRALTTYQNALIQAFPHFNQQDILQNPPLEAAWLESQAMYAAAAKAQVLLKLAKTQKNNNNLRLNAAHCYDLAFAVAAKLRHSYGNDADKLTLSTDNRSVSQQAALNLWQLWNDTNDAGYLERLYQLVEQTQAQALIDALQQQKGLALTGIPDSVLEYEAQLRLELARVTEGYESLESGADSLETAQLQQQKFRQERAYNDFIQILAQQYPQFRQYLDADNQTAVARQPLPDSTVLLSWFDAGDRYLCLQLKDNTLAATEVLRDSLLDRSLSEFIDLCADLNGQQSAPANFFTRAHALFRQLLPMVDWNGIKLLRIVPDGKLCYLPFEVLLSAPHTGEFATAPYLFRHCDIAYTWSVRLLESPLPEHQQQGFTQFAPFAQTGRNDLAVLANSLSDVPSDLQNNLLEGQAATKSRFLTDAPSNNVLHLSTHAQVGKNGVAGIELYDQPLTLPEIYAQRLKASLVSLSACETGAGHFAGGEGVLSLARAFAYAGARSMVASLWSVNDHATAELFSGFYQNLKKGLPKSTALRQSKLAYLAAEGSDARKAPFYWAAFTLTGADGPVALAESWKGLWIWGLGLFVLSMGVFWGFRRSSGGPTTTKA